MINFFLPILLFLFFGASVSAAPSQVRMTPVVRAVQNVAPAVVNITSSKNSMNSPLEIFFGPGFDPFGDFPSRSSQKRASLGSGIIVDGKKGLVLTNAHVISGGDEIMVHLQDGREFHAKVRGMEPTFDIAVLELENAPGLPSVPLGDSGDLMPGETVIAIGNPFGFNHTVTTGVISALNRSIPNDRGMLTDLIQTDAAINPGNSGGPLLNIEGQLIGINTAIDARGEGIGFAIPANKARRVMEGMMGGQAIEPLWLGLAARNIDQRSARALGLQGIVITSIMPGSPAGQAGLKPGDVITALNSAQIRNVADYLNTLRSLTDSRNVTVEVARAGERLTFHPKPAPFDDKTAQEQLLKQWGFGVRGQNGKIVVSEVQKNGPAAFLKKGDIIQGIGDEETRTRKDFLRAFRSWRMMPQILLLVERGGQRYYGRITP